MSQFANEATIPTQEQSHIDKAMQNLANENMHLADRVSCLKHKLEPVMRDPEPQKEGAEQGGCAESLSPLTCRIDIQAWAVRDASERIESILHLLDL